jgi:hypothetical protein
MRLSVLSPQTDPILRSATGALAVVVVAEGVGPVEPVERVERVGRVERVEGVGRVEGVAAAGRVEPSRGR